MERAEASPAYDAADDDDLMELFAGGDVDAFDALFDRHYALVFSYARSILGAADGAEEALQETFLALARQAGRYEGRGLFRPWLMRIVRSRCLNRLADMPPRAVPVGAGPEGVEIPAEGPTPARQVELADDVDAVAAALARLPRAQREALTLYAMDGMRYREIAEVLGSPINTVKTLIRRARAALAAALPDAWEGQRDE